MARAVRADRVHARLAELAEIGALPGGGVRRLALDDADRAARDRLLEWLREAGLRVEIDRIGNVFGLEPSADGGGADSSPRVVLTGSHLDTVTDGGRFDGPLGVVAGIEAIEAMRATGGATATGAAGAGADGRRPVGVVSFTNEEGVRFQPDMMGSLVFARRLTVDAARAVRDTDGKTVGAELDRIGYAGSREPGWPGVASFVELHVEQGPVLESGGDTIGVVEGVQGLVWLELSIRGAAGHAGATPMEARRDAGRAAAEIAAYVRRLCVDLGPEQCGTVGCFELQPGAVNVIPAQARLTVDLRNPRRDLLDRARDAVLRFAEATAREEGCRLRVRELARVDPAAFDKSLVAQVESSARALGFSTRRLSSGASHDAHILAPHVPSAMIFVPSHAGISHDPREETSPRDVEAGARVLAHVLATLAMRP